MAKAWILAAIVLPTLLDAAVCRGEHRARGGPAPARLAEGPAWYSSAEAIFYTRDLADRRAISADIDFTGTPTVLMTTDALDFDYEPGVRLTLGRLIGAGSLELSYFGVEDYQSSAQITAASAANGTLHSALAGFDVFVTSPPFDGADLHRISYNSNLQSAEINYRRPVAGAPWVDASWLAGVRYLRVHERFNFRADVNDWLGNGPAHGVLGAHTDNDLVGAQLGGEALWMLTQRVGLQTSAKGGLLGNAASQEGYIVYDMPPPGANSRDDWWASDHGLSSIVETGAFGVLQVAPRVKLRAGYQVLMVSGLALAPAQLNFGDDPIAGEDVRRQGNIVFHGPSCGVEAAW